MQGPAGPQGAQGPQGPQGPSGAVAAAPVLIAVGDTTLTLNDGIILVRAPARTVPVITLPVAAGNTGKRYLIQILPGGATSAKVVAAGGLVNGLTYRKVSKSKAAEFISDGTDWWLLP
ncbi:MAG: hypothetical protein AMXMBFR7_44660 [Planctomycetota bacterium]